MCVCVCAGLDAQAHARGLGDSWRSWRWFAWLSLTLVVSSTLSVKYLSLFDGPSPAVLVLAVLSAEANVTVPVRAGFGMLVNALVLGVACRLDSLRRGVRLAAQAQPRCHAQVPLPPPPGHSSLESPGFTAALVMPTA